MAVPTLESLYASKHGIGVKPPRLLCFDPGETTGYSVFHELKLLTHGQVHDKDVGAHAHALESLITTWTPEYLVIEDYKVYGWKADAHSWEALHTPRLIGALDYIASMRKIPVVKQMAITAKGFCTDDKLKTWHMWIKGQRHSRDSIRHGIYFTLFGKWAGGANEVRPK